MSPYNPNAGKCQYCGNMKTWETKVENPKTGKMMPAHIDDAGEILGDGDCPHWKARKMNKATGQGGFAPEVNNNDLKKQLDGIEGKLDALLMEVRFRA